MRNIYWVSMILTVVGGINWGLVGLFNLDLVATIFGEMTTLSRAVYIIVGLAAVTLLVISIKKCEHRHGAATNSLV